MPRSSNLFVTQRAESKSVRSSIRQATDRRCEAQGTLRRNPLQRRQNVLRHARSILYLSKDLPCRCGLGNLAQRSGRREFPKKRRISVNSTNALPCFGFFGCDCGHFGRSADRVARLLVNFGFCRIRFWYLVAAGSGISRKLSRIYFWNLTIDRLVGCYCLPNSHSCYSWCDYNSVLRTFYIHQHRPTGLTAAL